MTPTSFKKKAKMEAKHIAMLISCLKGVQFMVRKIIFFPRALWITERNKKEGKKLAFFFLLLEARYTLFFDVAC